LSAHGNIIAPFNQKEEEIVNQVVKDKVQVQRELVIRDLNAQELSIALKAALPADRNMALTPYSDEAKKTGNYRRATSMMTMKAAMRTIPAVDNLHLKKC